MPLTPEQHAQLQAVNTECNAVPYDSIPAPTEPPDWWSAVPMPGHSWVCRDYTQMKADKLKELGWPESVLSVILCWTEPVGAEGREYHAVLSVLDGDETWILDSRFDPVYTLNYPLAGYIWERRQVPGTTNFVPCAQV